MGNGASKESRQPGFDTSHSSHRHHGSPSIEHSHRPSFAPIDSNSYFDSQAGPRDRRMTDSGNPRDGSGRDRSDHGRSGDTTGRRETKQEREARRAERDRVAREKERERSMRDESIDGGYLVTQGVYTGPEDYNKPIVRQLMIQRRIAPFWRGLNDHSTSWTEYQLVAAARGIPIPTADAIPPEELLESKKPTVETEKSETYLRMYQSRHNTGYMPDLARPVPLVPDGDFVELNLLENTSVNGLPLEAYLYREAIECPICFLYYPPYLNQTRCCDQPICSECFVQIKRPDPHVPEHGDNTIPATGPNNIEPGHTEGELVSEPAACPFCVQPEFGVTYSGPPFMRGLRYPYQANSTFRNDHGNPNHPSTPAQPGPGTTTATSFATTRRRAASLAVDAPNVITTDQVRPDWALKLGAARAHAARRSAAATALHTAAFFMGNIGERPSLFGLRRERRDNPFGLPPPPPGEDETMPDRFLIGNRLNNGGSGGPLGYRGAPPTMPDGFTRRRMQQEELETMMLNEAIRLSLAAEEDRRKKEEKLAKKEAKKKEKEDKKAEKAAKKRIYSNSGNNSSSFIGEGIASDQSSIVGDVSNTGPKGKRRDLAESNGSAVGHPGTTMSLPQLPTTESLFMENAHHPDNSPGSRDLYRPSQLRQVSTNNSSSASSLLDSPRHAPFGTSLTPDDSNNHRGHMSRGSNASSLQHEELGTESMFNFQSLSAMISDEEKQGQNNLAENIGAAAKQDPNRGESSTNTFLSPLSNFGAEATTPPPSNNDTALDRVA